MNYFFLNGRIAGYNGMPAEKLVIGVPASRQAANAVNGLIFIF